MKAEQVVMNSLSRSPSRGIRLELEDGKCVFTMLQIKTLD